MDEKMLIEFENVVAHANNGNWIPMAILAGFGCVIGVLVVYIWNNKNKANEEKHKESKNIMKKLSESTLASNTLSRLNEARIVQHDKDIERLEKN